MEHPGATRIYNPTGVNWSTEKQTREARAWGRGNVGGEAGGQAGGQAASPHTAKGLVFFAMEDEDGPMTVFVRTDVY